MAQRTKTIEYAFPLATASVASGTARDFTQIAALAIPESSSRTFRSVTLDVCFVDNGAAAASMSAVLIGIALGAVARNDATVTFTLNNSGENQCQRFTRDVTSYFATNYTGTSMTADCRLTVTGLVTQNASAKLIITYEFDDSSASTRIKTIKIPMDGNTGNLTTSFVNLGGVANQIPILDNLPEPTKTFRDIFFEIEGHTGTTAAASARLDMSYDGGSSTVSDLAWGHSLNSDTTYRRIDNLLATLSTSATGTIQAKTTSATGKPMPCLSGVLVVTYEYAHNATTTTLTEDLDSSETGVDVTAASNLGTAPYVILVDTEQMLVTSVATNTLTVTRGYNGTTAASHSNGATVNLTIWNSVQLPVMQDPGYVGASATGDKSRYVTTFLVAEPATVALNQSAVFVTGAADAAVTLDLRCGSQGSRTFAHAASQHCGGGLSQMLRIDSGGASGSGITFARGWNTLTMDAFGAATTIGTLLSMGSGLLFLNYTSGKASGGADTHAHTTHWIIRAHATGGAVPRLQVAGTVTPNIPETSYYAVGVGYQVVQSVSGTVNPIANCVKAEIQSGEVQDAGAGWQTLASWRYQSDAEMSYSLVFANASEAFNRYPDDPADRLDLETARDYCFESQIGSSGDGAVWQAAMLLTYHAITFTKSGTVSAYADADGAGLTVRYYRSDTGAYVGTSTTTSGGAHSFTWYDDSVNLFAVCLEDSTHTGASWTG